MTTYSPAVNTYTPIETLTLTAASAGVTFSDLPQTYRDLIVVCDWAGSASANYMFVRLNGDTGTNYSYVLAYGAGSSGGSTSASSQTGLYTGIARTTKNATLFQIFDYSATDKHKTALSRYGLADMSEVAMIASRWANTAAVTSVTLQLGGNTFAIGSTFSLFGIKS
jgi:hypothetical protein